MSAPSDKSSDARGRSVVSKPVGEGTSTSTASKASDSTGDAPVSTPLSSSDGLDNEWGGFKVTKTSSETVTLNTSWKPRPPAPQNPVLKRPVHKSLRKAKTQATEPGNENDTPDSLEAAAEKNAWKYMLADTEETFRDARTKATAEIQDREAALAEAEDEVSDQRERQEAEKTLAFLDELSQESLAKQAPEVMIRFHAHADECSRIETEALDLVNGVSRPAEASSSTEEAVDEKDPLKPYTDMLQRLDDLHKEAVALQTSFADLTEKTSKSSKVDGAEDESGNDHDEEARVHIHAIFSSCGPVLNARIANLSLAQELVDTALQNVTLGLRMESMGIS